MLENVDIDTICCFTGHRPQKLPWGYDQNDERCVKIKKQVYDICENLLHNGVTHFITGMALGFDLLCAQVVLELQKQFPNVKLYGAIPCSNQCEKWNDECKSEYEQILSKLEDFRCKYVRYNPYCMQERNAYMVDHSSTVIALFNGTTGGTKNTIDYAQSKNRQVIIIDLNQFE